LGSSVGVQCWAQRLSRDQGSEWDLAGGLYFGSFCAMKGLFHLFQKKKKKKKKVVNGENAHSLLVSVFEVVAPEVTLLFAQIEFEPFPKEASFDIE
jgi:hypothetical protein